MGSGETKLIDVAKRAGTGWMADECGRLSAALAYYTMISIAPLLIVTVKVLSVFLSPETAKKTVQDQLQGLTSEDVAKALGGIMASTKNSSSGTLATVIGVVILLFGAAGVFGELQSAMNIIFKVKAKPHSGIWDWLRHRFLSLSMVFGIGFLLLVSLFISTALGAVTTAVAGDTKFVANAVEFVASLIVVSLLFAGIFKFLPDVKMSWRPVVVGALMTAVLFSIGKFLLAWYIKSGSTTSAYGAAGSLAALLIWVYYSAQILYFGAEITYAYADLKDEAPAPDEHAVAAEDCPPAPRRQWLTQRPARSPWPNALMAGVAGFAAGAGAWGAVRRARGSNDQLEVRSRIEAVARRVNQIQNFRETAGKLAIEERVADVAVRLHRAAQSAKRGKDTMRAK